MPKKTPKSKWKAAKISIAPIKASCRKESENEDTREQSVSPLSARSCVKRRKRAPRETCGGEDQRRRREARATSSVIPRSQKLISMEGRLKEGVSCEELYRVRTKRTEKPRMKIKRERRSQGRKTGQRDIGAFGGFQGDGEARWQVRVIGGDR